jgi:hypothetical protein
MTGPLESKELGREALGAYGQTKTGWTGLS